MTIRNMLFYPIVIVFLFHCVLGAEEPDFSDDNCVVDATLPREEEGNYMRCDTEEAIAANTPRCCLLDNTVGCCAPEEDFGRMAQIGTGIGCGTVFLMIVFFLIFWCDEETFPCLKKCKKRCNCCKKCKERREAKKKRKEEEKKRKEKEEEERKNAYAFRQEVTDDFWGVV